MEFCSCLFHLIYMFAWQVSLHVSMRILAAVGEEDGIARWIHH